MKCELCIKRCCLIIAVIVVVAAMYFISSGFFSMTESFTSNKAFNGDVGNDMSAIKKSMSDGKKCVIVFHAASWCGWSSKLIPVWNEYYDRHNKNLHVYAIEDKNIPKTLTTDLGIPEPNGFPTIISIENGNVKKFKGERTVSALLAI